MIFKNLERTGKIAYLTRTYLGIGAFTMSAGVLFSLFSKGSNWAIVGGLLLGISMVLNIAGLISFGKARRTQKTQIDFHKSN